MGSATDPERPERERPLLCSGIAPKTVFASRYEVEEELAEGATASVYRARDLGCEREVALKVLDPVRCSDPFARMRFAREFQALSRVCHPGVARCYELLRERELEILVLEHVPGETLESRLARGRLPVESAVEIGVALGEALECCHGAGVLHRDLKPANVMLHPERGPVILDFGVAWFSGAASLTRTGAVIGSPEYIAPEAFVSHVVDARADVYSLGAMLFEMLTGRPVHLCGSVAEMAETHLAVEAPPVTALRPEVGSALSEVVARAVAPRPESRFASALELSTALRRGRAPLRRTLQARLPCEACGTPLIVDLPFCPGCGEEVSWDLTPGNVAVQLSAVPQPDACAAWLARRYAHAIPCSFGGLRTRLGRPPVPLVTGVSRASAERLAAEARELGCQAQVIRAHRIIGARLRASEAQPREVLVAAGLHLMTVLGAGIVALRLGFDMKEVCLLPAAVGLLGILGARSYVRRPLLRWWRRPAGETPRGQDAALRRTLAALGTDRARRLAASAISRAAPLLLSPGAGAGSASRNDVLDALDQALEATLALDAQATLLARTSRSRLAAAIAEAEAQQARGQGEAAARLCTLQQELEEHTEASLAHDLAAREALDACRRISDALVGFTPDATPRRLGSA
jgi:tRNA A-37 threonylcarbamoyl transferase component Bud32